jgi:hypothetical protein
MKKWVLAVACLVLFMLIIVFAGLWNLGALIKKAVNSYGPGIINAEVHVAGVQTFLLSGEARLSNFYLGNPAGFKTPHALKAPSLTVDLNEASLFGNTIVIEKIELIRPEINYEKTKGTDNFKQLMKNSNGAESKAGKADKEIKGQGGKRLVIRNFIIRDAELTLALSGRIGHRVSARIQDIHLKNIGEEEGGLPPSAAFKILLSGIYSNITTPQNIIEELSRSTGRELKNASDTIKKLFYQ